MTGTLSVSSSATISGAVVMQAAATVSGIFTASTGATVSAGGLQVTMAIFSRSIRFSFSPPPCYAGG